jgi:hypothetical protein
MFLNKMHQNKKKMYLSFRFVFNLEYLIQTQADIQHHN